MPAVRTIAEAFGNWMGEEVTKFFTAWQSGDWSGVAKQFSAVAETAGETLGNALVKAFTEPGLLKAIDGLGNLLADVAIIFGDKLAGAVLGALAKAMAGIPLIGDTIRQEAEQIAKGFSPEQSAELNKRLGAANFAPSAYAANVYQIAAAPKGASGQLAQDFKEFSEGLSQFTGVKDFGQTFGDWLDGLRKANDANKTDTDQTRDSTDATKDFGDALKSTPALQTPGPFSGVALKAPKGFGPAGGGGGEGEGARTVMGYQNLFAFGAGPMALTPGTSSKAWGSPFGISVGLPQPIRIDPTAKSMGKIEENTTSMSDSLDDLNKNLAAVLKTGS
jgi:hypothetical protein